MREPPRAATVALLAALALLLFYPLHRPYQHPDQDLVPTLPLYFMASPTWRPRIVNAYGSALPNLLHVVDAVTLRIGRVAGWWTDPSDLLVAWCRAPATFRIAPRAVAMIAGLASLIILARINSAQGDIGEDLTLPAVAAVLVGGTSLFGGSGTVAGTLIGALILTLVLNGMNLLQINSSWQPLATGLIILLAVWIDTRTRKIGE